MWRTASRRECNVPVLAFVMSFSTNGRSSLAFASVVSIAPLSMSDDARFRISASFCSLVRRSLRRAPLRCRIALLLHVVRRGRGSLAGWRAPIEHAQPAVCLFEPHPEVEPLALEKIGNFLKRLLTEVLHLKDLAFGLPHEIAERPDVRILERVHGTNRELEIVDRRAQLVRHLARVTVARLHRPPERRRRVRAELDEVLE